MFTLKSKLFLSVAFVGAIAASNPLFAQSGPRPYPVGPSLRPDAPSVEPPQAQVDAAIQAASVTKNGKVYPKLAGNQTSAVCEIGQTRAVSSVAKLDMEGPDHAKKSWTNGKQTAVYSPPSADWVIQSYTRSIYSAGAPYDSGDSATPGNFSYNSSSTYNAVLQDIKNYVANLKLPKNVEISLNAKLDSFISNYISYTMSLNSSHSQVSHWGQIWGTGVTNFSTGHAWYHGYVNTNEICAPIEIRDSNALKSSLKTWVDKVSSPFGKGVSRNSYTPKS